MKLLLPLFLTIVFINVFKIDLYGQKKEYVDQCKLVEDLINTGDKTFFNFQRLKDDSTITILDVNHILTDCLIASIGQVRIIIINSGEEVDKVKRKGIFGASTNRKDLFVLTKEHLKNLTGFRVFHPKSNADFYWGFIKQKNCYHFSKQSSGWF